MGGAIAGKLPRDGRLSSHRTLTFNLLYSFDYTPAYANNMPQVDHIFPQSLLRKVKSLNPNTGKKDLIKYREPVRNQLANCMLPPSPRTGRWEGGHGAIRMVPGQVGRLPRESPDPPRPVLVVAGPV